MSTAIQILNLAGYNYREIMKISGHKSVTSLQSYHDRMTEKCQQSISQTIGNAVTKVGTREATKPRDTSMEHVNKSPISPVSSISLRSPPVIPLTLNQGRRKGGRRGGASPPLPFSKGAGGGESALRVKILTKKI